MRKITTLRIEYTYADAQDSKARLDRFYSWLINKAIDNLLSKQSDIDNNSALKYTQVNGQPGRISNTGGSSQNSQSREDYCLQDVPNGQASSGKVRQGLENKQQQTGESVGG